MRQGQSVVVLICMQDHLRIDGARLMAETSRGIHSRWYDRLKGKLGEHTELAVDPAHKLLHLLLQSSGGHEIVSTRYGHLDQSTLANEVWLSLKKIVECAEFLRYAFDAI